MSLLLVPLGLVAGLTTTLAGFGGGIFLVASLSLLWSPIVALTTTSMALFLGNAQRLYLFREFVKKQVARQIVLGAVPGAMVGSFLVSKAPSYLLQVAIVVGTIFSIGRAVGWIQWVIPRPWLIPGSSAVGFMAATTGGGGFILAPLLIGAGLRGSVFVAHVAVAGVALHVARIATYGATGLIDVDQLVAVATLAPAIMLGNYLARGIRRRIGDARLSLLEWGTPFVCGLLALAGLL